MRAPTPNMPGTPILSGSDRDRTPVDRWVTGLDQALRTVVGVYHSQRPNPAGTIADTITTAADRRHVAGLMRINHAGEVAAQALYAGQASATRNARR